VARNKKAITQADQSKTKLQEQVKDQDKKILQHLNFIKDKDNRILDLQEKNNTVENEKEEVKL
jgi:hypothetical protein